MGKSRVIRVVGFVGALGASAGLVGLGVSSTGAYFTASQNGSLNASSGHLKLSVSNPNLNFQDLVPGDYQTQNINYATDSTGHEDLWLVFPPSAGYDAFTAPKDVSGGGLGRYGHFAVSTDGNGNFTSYNLQNSDAGSAGEPVCPVDVNGDGGSNQQATSTTDTPPLCGVPAAIKLTSNLPTGSTGTIAVTFGITGRWTAQNAAVASVPFQIVATQPGVRPDAPNF